MWERVGACSVVVWECGGVCRDVGVYVGMGDGSGDVCGNLWVCGNVREYVGVWKCGGVGECRGVWGVWEV